ncbi:MAG TPA: SRPBCC family protein [Thermoanaerobaculia bacterium]|jgi:uncharacterized protein YndB with AHSA1/START domain
MSSDCEILNMRRIGAPRERVFRAWTDPEQLARWWGPAGFTNTFHEFDPRPGGAWRFVMHGPNGTDYKNESVFAEVGPERIVIDHISAPRFRLAADFADDDGGTHITWRMTFASAEECARVRGYVVPANEQNLDRLEAVLAGR